MSHHLANQFCALYVRCDLVQIKLAAVLSGWGFFLLVTMLCFQSLSERVELRGFGGSRWHSYPNEYRFKVS